MSRNQAGAQWQKALLPLRLEPVGSQHFIVLPRDEIAALPQPSVAGVLEAVVGPWGAVFVGIALIVAVLLAVRRRARAEGRDVTYASMPAALVSLARVYGIDGLLGCAEPADR